MIYPKTTILAIALAATGSADAFSLSPSASVSTRFGAQHRAAKLVPTIPTLRMVDKDTQEDQDNEIERLKTMAATLRAEAALLESQRQEELSIAVEKAFLKFDKNAEGDVGIEELKAGLEKELKMDVCENRVKKIMDDFDASGDGALQLDEFVTIEQFRNRLEQLAREEKQMAREAAIEAQKEEKKAKIMEEAAEMINDREPTGTEKIVATLPYLFPFLDSLEFGKYIILDNADNLFIGIVALFYALYRSIPFGGLIAFFALNILSSNPGINSLIRYNMQQAIFIDIALFVPGLLGAFASLLLSGIVKVPMAATVLFNDAIFLTVLVLCVYGAASSLFGKTPDKIPFISDAVNQRLPRFEVMDIDEFKKMNTDEKKDDEKKDQ